MQSYVWNKINSGVHEHTSTYCGHKCSHDQNEGSISMDMPLGTAIHNIKITYIILKSHLEMVDNLLEQQEGKLATLKLIGKDDVHTKIVHGFEEHNVHPNGLF